MKQKNSLLAATLLLVWLIFFTHLVALWLHLYWIFPWFDVFMHFLGGVWVGLVLLWLLYFSGYIPSYVLPKNTLFGVLLAGILLGLLWEVFEVGVQISTRVPFEGNWGFDTTVDVCMDTLGIILGAFWGRALYNAKKEARSFPPTF